MAGGTWTQQNKVRPGAYINTKSNVVAKSDSSRGRVLLATELNSGWGKTGAIELDSSSNFEFLTGLRSSDDKMKVLNEVFKGASTVVLVNNNAGNKASYSKTELPWDFTAKYAGNKGNSIVVNVVSEDNKNYTISTLFNNKLVDSQRVSASNLKTLSSNDVLDITLTRPDADLTKISGENAYTLTGGTTETVDMAELLGDAVQSETYEVATTAGYSTDNQIHELLVNMINEVRNQTGYKATAVVPYTGKEYNAEYVSVVYNGVVLSDGTELDNTLTAAGFAGLSSNIDYDQSLTYKSYPGAVETLPKMTNESIINALQKGYIVFSKRKNGQVVIEQDINNLVNDETKLDSLKKNRVIRILDYIENNTQQVFEDTFIGSVNNDDDGRALFKGNRQAFFKELSQKGLIDELADGDLTVEKGNDSDSMVVNFAVKPIDSIEKLYGTVTVSE
ncbi:phage tail protein [Lactobacillus sp. S2-2]|uniref:phage tail sheath C-terminal domain-containing protein n=1 Tax=Lactobacillus sp. S2-2 TaxID=2692917 RepID=UPI001F2B649B|nr:phage tail sheath C-terminal domain-containing protein [Lactobacillus sp. S2-2]MCF6515556.1 phage tail protein [Lactobacillus sp. S2-2]